MLRRRLLTGFGLLAIAAGGVLIAAVLLTTFFGIGSKPLPDHAFGPPITSFTAEPSPTEAAAPTEVPTTPTPAPSEAAIERIVIPKIGVDAPIVVLGVDANGVMAAPSAPFDVAWYDFTARPGWGSNAVFAGHVDFRPNIQAVFWYLRNLRQGDDIEVYLEDGTRYLYRVVSAATYLADDAPVQDIVGPTSGEVVTLITCTGAFNAQTREYDKRLIVRAERIYEGEDAPSASLR
jgi:LPXTG-site transpeptidase (sortase) family protein